MMIETLLALQKGNMSSYELIFCPLLSLNE